MRRLAHRKRRRSPARQRQRAPRLRRH